MAALDLGLSLGPATLVPQHTRPLHGEQEVRGVLTAYRWGRVELETKVHTKVPNHGEASYHGLLLAHGIDTMLTMSLCVPSRK